MAGRGGSRPGAGRKTNVQRLMDAQKAGESLAKWFTPEYTKSKWQALVESSDENVALKALIYLEDRLYGKPQQAVSMDVTGDIETRVTVDL